MKTFLMNLFSSLVLGRLVGRTRDGIYAFGISFGRGFEYHYSCGAIDGQSSEITIEFWTWTVTWFTPWFIEKRKVEGNFFDTHF